MTTRAYRTCVHVWSLPSSRQCPHCLRQAEAGFTPLFTPFPLSSSCCTNSHVPVNLVKEAGTPSYPYSNPFNPLNATSVNPYYLRLFYCKLQKSKVFVFPRARTLLGFRNIRFQDPNTIKVYCFLLHSSLAIRFALLLPTEQQSLKVEQEAGHQALLETSWSQRPACGQHHVWPRCTAGGGPAPTC